MKISELLNKKGSFISFEVFPPKTDSAFESVKSATEEIASLKPSFMSVTYGAGGGTSKYTLDIAENILKKYGVPTMAHLTCISSTKESVKEKIEQIKNSGVENIMALRGDIPPELIDSDRSKWDYRHAVELIRDIKLSGGDFCIGGACYPETHPESIDKSEDIKYLKEKVDAGLSFLTTQMFFDNKLYYGFLDDIKKAGIFVPVVPGIMPITNIRQIERSVALSGSFVPKELMDLADKFGQNADDMKRAGIEFAEKQIEDLFKNGVKNVHVYTMNKPDVAQIIKSDFEEKSL